MSGSLAKLNSDIDKMPTSITTPPPQLQAMPKTPAEAPSTPYKGLETWGTVLALLGSLRTANPMTAAIGSAASAMTAWNRRRYSDYRTELQKYQMQMRSALANNQNLLTLYRADIEQNKDNAGMMLDKLKARAAAEGDQIMLDRLNQEGMLGMARLNVMRETAGAKLALAQESLALNQRKADAALLQSYINAGASPPPDLMRSLGLKPGSFGFGVASTSGSSSAPGSIAPKDAKSAADLLHVSGGDAGVPTSIPGAPTRLYGPAYASLTNPLEQQAWMIANYRLPASGGSGFGGKTLMLNARLKAMVLKMNPSWSEGEYESIVGAKRDWASGKDAGTLTHYNTAILHAGATLRVLQGLKNGQIPTENWLVNTMRQASGDPNITNAKAALEVMMSELSQALFPGGGGEEERARLMSRLSENMSPAQIRGTLSVFAKLLRGREDALINKFRRTTRQNPPASFIMPEAQRVITEMEAAGAARDPKPMIPGATAAPKRGAPSASDIAYLKAHFRGHPNLIAAFDGEYGPGAAERILGQ